MLTSLRIQNFKSWRDTGDMALAPITGLFGANSSGKSSILQFLLMLKQTADSPDRHQVLDFGKDAARAYVDLGAYREVVYKDQAGKRAENIEWTIGWQHPVIVIPVASDHYAMPDAIPASSHFHAIVGEAHQKINRQLAVQQFEYRPKYVIDASPLSIGMKHLGGLHYEFINHGFFVEPLPAKPQMFSQPTKNYGFPADVKAGFTNTGFLSDLELRYDNLFAGIYYLGPLREPPKRIYQFTSSRPSDVGRRGEFVIDALLASRSTSEGKRSEVEFKIAEWLRRLGLIHSFTLKLLDENSQQYQVLVQQSSDSASVSLPDVGFGVSQVLPVLTLCYYVPEGSIILFEQPEIHLHPKVQADMADVFVDVAKNRNVQIILESHSEHLLARLQRRMAEHGIKEQGISSDQVALYFCERQGAESVLKPLEINNFGYITNWPEDFFGDDMGERAAMMEAAIERRKRGEAA